MPSSSWSWWALKMCSSASSVAFGDRWMRSRNRPMAAVWGHDKKNPARGRAESLQAVTPETRPREERPDACALVDGGPGRLDTPCCVAASHAQSASTATPTGLGSTASPSSVTTEATRISLVLLLPLQVQCSQRLRGCAVRSIITLDGPWALTRAWLKCTSTKTRRVVVGGTTRHFQTFQRAYPLPGAVAARSCRHCYQCRTPGLRGAKFSRRLAPRRP